MTEIDKMLKEAREIREAMLALQGKYGGVGNSTITFNMNGIGVWLAVVACAITVAVTWQGNTHLRDRQAEQADDIRELRAKVNAQQAYLNAIYQAAPQLKPKEK